MSINITMPALSPTMEEGKLAKWHVKEGDSVSSGDVIAEIETDKATMEVEAVDEGKIGKIYNVVPRRHRQCEGQRGDRGAADRGRERGGCEDAGHPAGEIAGPRAGPRGPLTPACSPSRRGGGGSRARRLFPSPRWGEGGRATAG